MTCEQVMSNGKQCKANAMHDSKFCFMHNPETKNQVKEAGRKGGFPHHRASGGEISLPVS